MYKHNSRLGNLPVHRNNNLSGKLGLKVARRDNYISIDCSIEKAVG
jgi:hypothetical protein